jgi:hypothetical protein
MRTTSVSTSLDRHLQSQSMPSTSRTPAQTWHRGARDIRSARRGSNQLQRASLRGTQNRRLDGAGVGGPAAELELALAAR